MKKTLSAVSALALALSGMSAPAYAAIDDQFGGESPTLDAECDLLLNPNDNSDFTTYAYGVDERTAVVRTPFGNPMTTTLGDPTTTLGAFKDAHVNGQSVNIHANRDVTVTYLGGTKTVQTTKVETTQIATGKCHVHKPAGKPQPDSQGHVNFISPGGLEGGPPSQDAPVDASGDTVTTYEEVTTFDTRPFVDINASGTKEFVICISPSTTLKKGTPGVWRGQNDYVMQLGRACSTLWHNELGSSQPTASLPAS